ncbi:MAG: thermonuclease family protein [Candidatus Omnitrophica bacterium]|nr:thermonuclease family protein [Candidatus Omnitrophota bacterium]
MPKSLIATSSYQNLIIDVSKALSSGLLAAQKALEHQRLKTYWQIGKQICRAVKTSNGTISLSEKLYQDISRDIQKQAGLDLAAKTIGRAIQFSKNYPTFPENTTLGFTHYLALMRVHDPRLRLQLEKKAIKEGMKVEDVKVAVAKINVKRDPSCKNNTHSLAVARGEPFVYHARRVSRIDGKDVIVIDCGFKINIEVPLHSRYKPVRGRIIRSTKEPDGQYQIHTCRKTPTGLYTYPAFIARVVDGDTVDARIDVGFGIWVNERLRLKGINAPEITTQAGLSAKHFLSTYFKKCPGVIIRTHKEGMYGRWLADIFALKGCKSPHTIAREGEYLNQILLDQGLAEIY